MAKIRLGLMYSDEFMLEARRMLFASQPDFDVVYENSNALEALEGILDSTVDVLVVDTRLRSGTGIDFAARMHRRYLSSEVKLPKVVLTAPFFSETLLLSAIRAGVADLVTEADGVEALLSAIRAANQVNAETSYSELKTFFELQNVEPGSNPRWLLRLTDLSTRESSVLEQLEMGLSDSEISEKLGITETSIRRAIATLMGRMGVATRAQFALALFEAGVLFSKKPSKKATKAY